MGEAVGNRDRSPEHPRAELDMRMRLDELDYELDFVDELDEDDDLDCVELGMVMGWTM